MARPRTSLCAKSKDDDDDEQSEEKTQGVKGGEKDGSVFDRVGRLGSRVISSVKGGDKSRRKKWVRRFARIDGSKDNDDEAGRTVNTFGQQQFSDPFNSEVTLQNELQKQKALKDFLGGNENQIPSEFLPDPSNTSNLDDVDPLGVEKNIATLDESLMYIKNELVGMNAATAKKDQIRLNKIRRDLEIRRKKEMLLKEKRKKEIELRDRARAEKLSRANAKFKKEQTERYEYEKRMKERERVRERMKLQRTIIEASKGQRGGDTAASNKDDQQIDGSENGDEKKRMGVISNVAEGVMNTAQSAASNAWQAVRSKAAVSDDWIPVCPKTRVSPGEVYPVVAGGLDLLIIGSKDGTKVFCVSNRCPHLGTPLETGIVERRKCPKQTGQSLPSNSLSTEDDTRQSINDGLEECIVCPLHQTAFSLDTGNVQGEWCPYPPVIGKVMGTVKAQNNLTTFEMRTRGKNIEIKISSALVE